MVQHVTVTADTSVSLRPLLEAAVRTELKLLEHGINRTRERLAAFEKRFGMASAEFERRFKARELSESLEFIEWLGEVKTLRLLEDKQRALEDAQFA